MDNRLHYVSGNARINELMMQLLEMRFTYEKKGFTLLDELVTLSEQENDKYSYAFALTLSGAVFIRGTSSFLGDVNGWCFAT